MSSASFTSNFAPSGRKPLLYTDCFPSKAGMSDTFGHALSVGGSPVATTQGLAAIWFASPGPCGSRVGSFFHASGSSPCGVEDSFAVPSSTSEPSVTVCGSPVKVSLKVTVDPAATFSSCGKYAVVAMLKPSALASTWTVYAFDAESPPLPPVLDSAALSSLLLLPQAPDNSARTASNTRPRFRMFPPSMQSLQLDYVQGVYFFGIVLSRRTVKCPPPARRPACLPRTCRARLRC